MTKKPGEQTEHPDYMTPRQASQLLQVPESTLSVWRSTSRVIVPYFKLGGHVRYRRADLERFIASNMRNVETSDVTPIAPPDTGA